MVDAFLCCLSSDNLKVVFIMRKINIVSVWTWFCNILDTQTLTASQQLIMVHLIKILNRNFWRPTNISISALSRSIGKDNRTVKNALTHLKNCNLILETEFGLFINVTANQNDTSAIQNQITKTKNDSAPFKNSSGTIAYTENQLQTLESLGIDIDTRKKFSSANSPSPSPSPSLIDNLPEEERIAFFKRHPELNYGLKFKTLN